MIAETKNFFECNLVLVKRILYSSELHLTSEFEVFDAADNWIRHNTEERRKFAKDLLLSVRLPLLSDHALNYLLCNKTSTICKVDECKSIIQSVLLKKETFTIEQISNGFTSRYCSQSLFNIFNPYGNYICIQKLISYNNFDNITTLDLPATTEEYISKAVCLKSDFYLFVEEWPFNNLKIKKYSNISKVWESEVVLNYRSNFCACVLMDNIYIIGGSKLNRQGTSDSCIQYDTKKNKKKEVAKMNQFRSNAACVIFEGKVVVSGGRIPSIELANHFEIKNTVEIYDHVADLWSYMPNMVYYREDHSLIVIKSKMFVVGRRCVECEVFDKFTNKFVIIKSSPIFSDVTYRMEEFEEYRVVRAISIGNEIAVLGRISSTTEIFDIETEEWHEESNKFYNSILLGGCWMRIPQA